MDSRGKASTPDSFGDMSPVSPKIYNKASYSDFGDARIGGVQLRRPFAHAPALPFGPTFLSFSSLSSSVTPSPPTSHPNGVAS